MYIKFTLTSDKLLTKKSPISKVSVAFVPNGDETNLQRVQYFTWLSSPRAPTIKTELLIELLIYMPMSQKLTSLTKINPIDPVKPQDRQLSWKVASNLFTSFKYAWAGVSYAFITQRNFRIHVCVGTSAIALSLFLHLQPVEIAVIGITSGLVLALELVNTAIESLVDLTVKQTYHDLAKIAKDCAAAAVLISALVAVLVAAMLLLPPLLKLVLAQF